ncbi:MAG: aldehyde dehydrogenase family protein, partial [Stenotrophomonas sp.]
YQRLIGYLTQARERGVPVIELASIDPERARRERLIVPTIVLDPPADLDLMQEEIFGPILPVCAYPDLEGALQAVQGRDRPLALYVFSQQRDVVERVLGTIVAGGVTVNDTLLHFAINGLPFGGVGPSGMGAYHGRAGFDAMSKQLPILWQSRWAASDLLKPPYSKIAGLLKAMIR